VRNRNTCSGMPHLSLGVGCVDSMYGLVASVPRGVTPRLMSAKNEV